MTAPNSAAQLLRRALAVLLLGGTAVVTLHYWLGVGEDLDFAIGGPLYAAIVLGAGVACLVRASDYRRERTAWLLIGLAIFCWGAAEVYWTAAIEGNPSAPYPSPADVGYLVFYPLAYAGLVMLVRARAHEINWRLWMDGLIAALGTAALGTAFVFDFVADQTSGTTLEMLTTLSYPLGDIGMLSLVVGVVALTGWRPGRTWSLLLAGLAALVIADIAYTLQATEGALPGGEWVNPIYLVAAVCLGAAVWQPKAAAEITSPVDDGRREILVPAIFAAVMIGLFAMQYNSTAGGLSTVLWAATMTAVIVRLAMSDRENKRLLGQVQTDPLTGLGNRGRMQVDLERLCELASEDNPAALLFLDLNGFKHLNDTLGHPAGDELLARLGQRLRDAIAADGTAYRIGGDEFCVLLSCAESRLEEATKRAAEALTESGRGYAISASWGAARMPNEADTPSTVLQLADVRMYAQKESRRGEPAAVTVPAPETAEGAIKAGRG
ncbi:MAG TPA: GGDEF domain-containing protein [Solirubrobacterales bacterium]|nr:GGDEF domain-containing protein [Solirubrobacterales bacterium]